MKSWIQLLLPVGTATAGMKECCQGDIHQQIKPLRSTQRGADPFFLLQTCSLPLVSPWVEPTRKPAGKKRNVVCGVPVPASQSRVQMDGFRLRDNNLITGTHGLRNNTLRQVLLLSLGLSLNRFYFVEQF